MKPELINPSGVVLEKVCEYLYYNQKHADSKDVSDMDIPPELCLELLIAADFLDGTRAPPHSGRPLILHSSLNTLLPRRESGWSSILRKAHAQPPLPHLSITPTP
jgi:hypothetical protein